MVSDVIEVLSKEAEERKLKATERANQPLPEFIKSIDSTAVVYTISPKLLPFAQLNSESFLQKVKSEFSIQFRKPPINSDQLVAFGINPNDLTEDKITQMLLNQNNPQLAFEHGRYKTGSNKFVVIKHIEITSESIGVEVEGVTEIAEDIVSQIFNIFWGCCNADANWDSNEVQKSLQLKQYKTITKITLGGKTNGILNPKLVEFLDANMFTNLNIGKKALPYSQYDNFKPAEEWNGSWSLEDFDFTVAAFNNNTLRTEQTTIQFVTSTKEDRGRGVLRVTTTLPYQDHVEFISSLVESMSV
ncbi:MAG: hypothetical protein JAZ17_01870 [Candidatus Thiodiazotropha endolucinida]|nr:hypothetical protein [Candidatus Thiodiazotropha endolucinida]